jgi:GrpB-like predicted nucleotidyltransferase (UPF0157 family)
MEAINHRNLVEELRKTFPEIESRYQEEERTWDEKAAGEYNVFGYCSKTTSQRGVGKSYRG